MQLSERCDNNNNSMHELNHGLDLPKSAVLWDGLPHVTPQTRTLSLLVHSVVISKTGDVCEISESHDQQVKCVSQVFPAARLRYDADGSRAAMQIAVVYCETCRSCALPRISIPREPGTLLRSGSVG